MAGQIVPYRPVTAADKVDAIDTVAKAVKPVFEDVFDRVSDYPAFIESNEPRSPVFAAARSVARLNCRIWAASDKSEYSPRVNSGNTELCGPFLDSIGEKPDEGELRRQFDGGQCPVIYRLTYRYNSIDTGGATIEPPVTQSAFVLGPVGPVRGEGAPEFQSIVTTENGGQPRTLRSGSCAQGCYRNIEVVSIVRLDEQPDDCGNMEPEVRPPATVTPVTPIPPSITVGLPGIGDVEVTVTIGPGGDPKVCIPILGVCEDFTINPEGEGDGGDGGDGGGPPPGDVGEPGLPDSTGEGGESSGAAPNGSVLVGLRLDLLVAPSSAKRYAPNIYRGGAYIYMGTPQGLDQDYAGSMLRDGQFVFAEKDNLTRWSVRANVGFNWRVTPYYREVE